LTAASGSPTVAKYGSPLEISTSTSIRYASMPRTALLNILDSIILVKRCKKYG
jgi:hypothetical protein